MQHHDYIRRPEAAAYLRERYGFGSWRSLAKLACVGGGPRYFRFGGAALYRRADLDAWVTSRLISAGQPHGEVA